MSRLSFFCSFVLAGCVALPACQSPTIPPDNDVKAQVYPEPCEASDSGNGKRFATHDFGKLDPVLLSRIVVYIGLDNPDDLGPNGVPLTGEIAVPLFEGSVALIACPFNTTSVIFVLEATP